MSRYLDSKFAALLLMVIGFAVFHLWHTTSYYSVVLDRKE